MRFLICLGLCLLMCVCEAQVLSYNIKMLPFHRNMERADVFIDSVLTKDYDVICLQEVFDNDVKMQLIKKFKKKYPYYVYQNVSRVLFFTNSGLIIFCKVPIIAAHFYVYKNKHGIDAFASKGFLEALIEYNGKNVWILNTHMQSENVQVTLNQAQELTSNKMFGKTFLIGDFNIDRNDDVYEEMVELLQVNDHGYSYNTWNEKMLDHCFYEGIRIKTVDFKISDHKGIEVEID